MTSYDMRMDALPVESREMRQGQKSRSGAAPFIAIAAAAVALLAIEMAF